MLSWAKFHLHLSVLQVHAWWIKCCDVPILAIGDQPKQIPPKPGYFFRKSVCTHTFPRIRSEIFGEFPRKVSTLVVEWCFSCNVWIWWNPPFYQEVLKEMRRQEVWMGWFGGRHNWWPNLAMTNSLPWLSHGPNRNRWWLPNLIAWWILTNGELAISHFTRW